MKVMAHVSVSSTALQRRKRVEIVYRGSLSVHSWIWYSRWINCVTLLHPVGVQMQIFAFRLSQNELCFRTVAFFNHSCSSNSIKVERHAFTHIHQKSALICHSQSNNSRKRFLCTHPHTYNTHTTMQKQEIHIFTLEIAHFPLKAV